MAGTSKFGGNMQKFFTVLFGAVLIKLNNCTDAIRKGVNNVHILDGRIPHCILLEIFTKKGVGTMFMADDDALVQGN